MRVRLIFSLKNKGSFLPFHHQYILAQFLKGLIVKGGKEEFYNYNFFNFSGLKGQTKVSRSGLHYYSSLVTLVLSSQSEEFIDYLLEQVFATSKIELGNLILSPEYTELEAEPILEVSNKFVCISPLVLITPAFNEEAGKRFINPDSDEFSDLLYESTLTRMEKSGWYSPEQMESFFKFQVVPDMVYVNKLKEQQKKFARIYAVYDLDVKYEVRGYTLPFTLYAAPEVQDFVFKCGLGAFTHKGFGMMDLATHPADNKTTPYKFKREGFVPYKATGERVRQNVAPTEEETEAPTEES
ncbi:MAG: CRISPR-associated endoribonuclease Cas6 [Algoriphagus sp.]|uniref:CRISPR-associated endoribonuclease Cas6 n=2 Tax=Algoriphagus sp. TaxID=1872435 RepID=UPI00276A83F4|nr:CRISPR-associated endoribonuclease Cas6 [Algoriphagus sp.]MDP4748228.1 CRISPR-associated endoribonuclease Cas6 [Algoriphagus sp.]MDP4838254.1 CRISPR-associated endoribonuclease Cas6 [Algoriphagus sp.]MDP4904889.1 CRISPR-associated endoribonuclease Cas6 [Algoriphagus sp.]MDP4958194.1 CRISPR-associated endoribonuclease Cas6 [Algoriphagus sp.]